MPFNALHLRFIRFLGPGKDTAEYTFTSGLNILWGSSDTGKTFLVEAIDFMLGAGDPLKDVPERIGYDRILMGITTSDGKDYTIHRSMNGGAFKLFDGLLDDIPQDANAGKSLSAGHNSKNYNNLSNWLLQQIGLDGKEILYNKKGTLKSLGFRALAHLCIIPYPNITKTKSPLLSGQWIEATREYGVFRLLLTGVDDSAVTPDAPVPVEVQPNIGLPSIQPDVLAQMISDYEDQLAGLTQNPEGLDAEETAVEDQIAELENSVRIMEGRLSDTTAQRKEVYERYARLTARRNEIAELQERFKLLNAQYTNDIKRLTAIHESGRFFVLLDPMACPLCGAEPEDQEHDAACDGNVASVAQAAAAEIAKTKLLQTELHGTVTALAKEDAEIFGNRRALETELRGYQRQIETALSPDFSEARRQHEELIEKRGNIRQAVAIQKRIQALRRHLDEPAAPPPEKQQPDEETPEVDQYIPKSVLRDFSKIVEKILQEWHFPNAVDVYFDEKSHDVVIDSRLRGSRGAGLCAITYSAFTLALFEYCRSRNMPHPGLVILDSPLIAYKEPKAEDEGIAGTDLKQRFYEHLESFAGNQQIFIVDNKEPPDNFMEKATHFTKNPSIGRYGLFPHLEKTET